jgi:ketosteroid isomerase-like protein
VKATGKKVDSRGFHLFTVKNGKVTRFLEIFDSAAAVEAYRAAHAAA